MARPKIKTKRTYTRRAPTEKTLGESIIEQMVRVNDTLAALVLVLKDRQPATTPDRVDFTPGLPPAPATPAEVAAAIAPPKKRGRRSNAEIAAAKAAEMSEPASTVLEKAAEGEPVHKTFPKACPCGVREDLPAHLHAQACPVHGKPGEPVPARVVEAVKPPVVPLTVDDVRGAAIAFAGKHGKERLASLLSGYSAGNLSGVNPTHYPALMAALQAG